MALSDTITDTWTHIVGQFSHQNNDIWSTLHSLKSRIGAQSELFINELKSANSESVLQDVKGLKITPVTVTLAAVVLTTLVIVGSVAGGNSSTQSQGKKKKKPKKKVSRAQKANHEIQKVLDYVEDTYVPQIDEYLSEYKSMKPEDVQFKYKYFEEMLLKELMKLDGIDVTGNEVLRENRRKVIKFVQDHQKRLDKFKKEAQF
ncbi:hypothetical protein JA9_001485 [Meyerozyma sp. JA9]|nr:hypothetical protein JA9_001485 [Meyerozyma sp. JA9]